MSKTCGNCAHIDQNNYRKHSYFGDDWNTYYCHECGGYHKETETACRYYQERLEPSKSGCFITTMVVNILGYPDNCVILNTIRDFRNKVLQKDIKYHNLLLTYDKIGPQISANLLNYSNKEDISLLVSQYYLIPICDFITKEDYRSAITLYIKMVRYLQNQLMVFDNIEEYQYDKSVSVEEMGHGKASVIPKRILKNEN